MGTDLTNEKLEKIKLNYKKKKTENNFDEKLVFQNQKSKNQNKENKENINITLKNLYKKEQHQKLKEESKKNNFNIINNIDITINTIKSEEKPKIKNNIELIKETKEINNIIFRNHKSFEPINSTLSQIKDDTENTSKIENDTTNSMTITTNENENTNKICDPNSAPDSLSSNSDYIDISQSTFFNKKNKKYIFYKKELYGNSKNIRDAYYNKLIIKNIWKPNINNKKSNTLFFFDWDDTLMCTSYIMPIFNSNNLKININKIKEKLKNLDENISNLLNKALERGIVFLITNASPGWVEYSSTTFLPLTSNILNKVKIFSAKGLFSKNFPGDPTQWKIKSFKYAIEKNNINTKIISNIICFGDSFVDLEAIESLRYCFTNAFIKVIKFKESPHLIELEKQIYIVLSQLDFILKKVKNLTLRVSKKKID